jgi:hypothetical protein
MAKTQYSFTTDPTVRGAPTGHSVPVREVRLSAGAGFIVAICGEIMTMPGLPKVPSAEVIRLNDRGPRRGPVLRRRIALAGLSPYLGGSLQSGETDADARRLYHHGPYPGRNRPAGRRPVEQVVQNVRRHASVYGLPPDLVEELWRRLIDWSIAREESRLGPDSLRKG